MANYLNILLHIDDRFGSFAKIGEFCGVTPSPASDLAAVFGAERSARIKAIEIVDDIAGRAGNGPAGAALTSDHSGG